MLGHQLNVSEYTTQELLEKVQLADSLFDQGTYLPTRPFPSPCSMTSSMTLPHPPPPLIPSLSVSSVGATRSDARLCLPRDGIQHARGQSARDESGRGHLRH